MPWLLLSFLTGCTFNELYGPFEMTRLQVTDGAGTHSTDDAGFIDFQDSAWYAWNRVYSGNGEFTTVLDPTVQSVGLSAHNLAAEPAINLEFSGGVVSFYGEVYDNEGRLLLSAENIEVLLTPL